MHSGDRIKDLTKLSIRCYTVLSLLKNAKQGELEQNC